MSKPLISAYVTSFLGKEFEGFLSGCKEFSSGRWVGNMRINVKKKLILWTHEEAWYMKTATAVLIYYCYYVLDKMCKKEK